MESVNDELSGEENVGVLDEPVMVKLRCHAPIEQSLAEDIVAAHMKDGKFAALDTVSVANWFGETWLEGKLICVAAGMGDAGVFHLWKGTHWVEIPDAWVEHDIDQLFRAPRLTNEIVKMIRRRCWTPRATMDSHGSRIFLRNTVLELQGKVLVEHPHSRSHYNTTFIDVDYDASKKAHPVFDKFLGRMLPDPDSQKLLQEIFGYCLVRNLDFGVFFLFFGPQGTGKSTTTSMLELLLGGRVDDQSNKMIAPFVTAKGLESFGDRFGAAGLEKSLVNISNESTYLSAAAERILKQITGGDSLSIEYKNRDAFTVTCAPKIIVATNTLPTFSDASDALNARAIILPFDVPVNLGKATGNIAAKIFKAEGQAILNWAIEGLLRLVGRTGMRREKFTLPKASILATEENRENNNPVVMWAKEQLEIKPGMSVTKSACFDDFQEFCQSNHYHYNHPLRQSNNFYKALRGELIRLGVPVGVDDRSKAGTSRVRVFRGVQLVSTSIHATGGNRQIKE